MKDQHEEFCRQYVVDFNARAAARRAGFAAGYGCELMKRDDVRECIALLLPDPGDDTIRIPRDRGAGVLIIGEHSETRIGRRSLKVMVKVPARVDGDG